MRNIMTRIFREQKSANYDNPLSSQHSSVRNHQPLNHLTLSREQDIYVRAKLFCIYKVFLKFWPVFFSTEFVILFLCVKDLIVFRSN